VFHSRYALYELKKWARDSLLGFFIAYPLILGLAVRWLIPVIEEKTGASIAPYYFLIEAALLLTPLIVGAVAGFSILEDRDDNILLAIKVAPMSLEFFIGLKLFLVFALSVLGSAFAIWVARLAPVSAGTIWAVSVVSALSAPLTALLVNAVASNKIEGFAMIKGTGVLIIFPIVGLLFFDAKEFLFSFVPGFWPAKALAVTMLPQHTFQLGYAVYLLIGLVYALLINLLAYRLFRAKVS